MITWQQFKDAYNWDQSNFSLPVHERLSEQHFELDSAAKMRNHLAEDVLDRKMLFLMQVCKLPVTKQNFNCSTITDSTSLGSLYIKGTGKSTQSKDWQVPLMQGDLRNHDSLILIETKQLNNQTVNYMNDYSQI